MTADLDVRARPVLGRLLRPLWPGIRSQFGQRFIGPSPSAALTRAARQDASLAIEYKSLKWRDGLARRNGVGIVSFVGHLLAVSQREAARLVANELELYPAARAAPLLSQTQAPAATFAKAALRGDPVTRREQIFQYAQARAPRRKA